MFFLSKPTPTRVREVIAAHSDAPFSYPEVGATRTNPPSGYTVDHNRVQLGFGEDTFALAAAAIRAWKQFDLGWVHATPDDTPIKVDAAVAVVARHMGFWSLNVSRIVYVIEERGAVEKFGFAYGTLKSHVERGEERFTVEWNRADDSVWYDILAFSRPNLILIQLGKTYARVLQRRFARDSLRVMRQAVSPSSSATR